MKVIKRNAILPYSSAQMYELVNDVAKYAEFLPWCNSSEVIDSNDELMVGQLGIAWSGMKQSFTTSNKLVKNKSIEMQLVDGPFHHLGGLWEFTELQEDACQVDLTLEFDLSIKVAGVAFVPVFNHIGKTLVTSFCKRADEVYSDDKN